jgi:hypothetical protein
MGGEESSGQVPVLQHRARESRTTRASRLHELRLCGIDGLRSHVDSDCCPTKTRKKRATATRSRNGPTHTHDMSWVAMHVLAVLSRC